MSRKYEDGDHVQLSRMHFERRTIRENRWAVGEFGCVPVRFVRPQQKDQDGALLPLDIIVAFAEDLPITDVIHNSFEILRQTHRHVVYVYAPQDQIQAAIHNYYS